MWRPDREALPREDLERLQLHGMRATLARVLSHAAYARRFGDVRPPDMVRPAEWSRLPFLTKEELRDAYPFGLACGGTEGYRRVHMSSGTSGHPILNPYTAADVEQWGEIMARCYVAAGVTASDIIQITPSFGLFTGGFGFHYGAEKLGAMVIPTGAGRTSLQLRLLRDLKATVVTAIATYPLRLIEVAREEGFDLGRLSLRVGILGSEMWSDELRATNRAWARHPGLRHHRHDRDRRPRPGDRLRGAGRHSRVGGSLLCGDRGPGHRACAC